MFIRRSILSVRNRALLLVLLPLLSLVTLFTPLFSQTASAVTADEVLNRARAWSILSAVIEARGKIETNISNSNADNCDIYGSLDDDGISLGHHVTGHAEFAQWDQIVGNTGNINAALASVGIEGGCRGLLMATGYEITGDGLREPADYGNRLTERIRAALDPGAFFGRNIGDESPGDALSYAILYYDLINVCGWSYRNSFVRDDNPSTPEGTRNRQAQQNGWSGDNSDRHYYTYTYENGKAGENTYHKGGGSTGDIYVGPKSGIGDTGGFSAVLDCGDNNADTFGAKLADNRRFADAYAALLKPGGNTTPGTCLDRYGGSPAVLAACDAGYKNKNDPAFCANTYTRIDDVPLKLACEYGQGTATGGADTTTPLPGSGPDNAGNKTTCAIEGVGWIICPIVTFLSKITDAAYTVVASLLEVKPLSVTGDSGIFNAWSIMRNFANISFVMAFLLIIFSQLSNVGISNYGIKKLLPKLVVAAILVNVSYWICAIAVDISNILGGSLNGLLLNVQKDVGLDAKGFSWTEISGGLLGGTVAGVAITGTLFFVGLAVLLPMLVTVLATIITVFLALVLRQALIIILIVISPLAFVAFLLPNTEPLFNKWRSTFQLLLVIYPVIAIVFGGAALASTIIMMSSDVIYIQIAGAAAAVIPLMAAPALMKVINGIGSRFGLPNVGLKLEGMRKGAEGIRDRRKDIATTRRLERAQGVLDNEGGVLGARGSRRRRTAAWVAGSGASRALNSEQKDASAKRALAEGKQDYVVDRVAKGDDRYAQVIAGPTGDISKVKAAATAAKVKEFNDEVSAEKATMTSTDAAGLDRIMRDTTASETRRAAAAGQLMKVGKDADIHQALDYLGTQAKGANGKYVDPAMSSIQQQVGGDLGTRKPTSLGAGDMTGLNRGDYNGDFASKIAGRLSAGKLSAEALSKTSADELDAIMGYVGANSASLKADPATAAAMKALENDINQYRKNTLINQPPNEVGSRMDTLHAML